MLNPIFFIFTNIYSPFRTSLRGRKGGALPNKHPREKNIQPVSSKTSLFLRIFSSSIHVVFRRILPFLLNLLMRITHESRYDTRINSSPINNRLDFCLLVSVSVLHSDFTLLNFFQFEDYLTSPGPLSLENKLYQKIKSNNKEE